MTRKTIRNDRLEKTKTKTQKKQNLLMSRFQWFQEHVEAKKYTVEELCQFVEQYLQEKDDEFEAEKKRKNGKYVAYLLFTCRASTTMEMVHGQERQMYNEGGIEVPDLTQHHIVTIFSKWDGTSAKELQNFKPRKVTNSNLSSNLQQQAKQQAKEQAAKMEE